MKKILLLSALMLGMSISNATIAQQKAPMPKKGSDQVVPDYKKPSQVSAPKSNKPTNVPKGDIKSTGSAAATPNTIKPGKGSDQVVPDYKKPTHLPTPKSGKPINAPKTAEGVKPAPAATKPTKDKPALPSNAISVKPIEQKTRDGAITNTKGQQGPKPGKGSDQVVPDYKKPTHLPTTKGGKPTSIPKAGTGVKPAPTTGKPTGGIKPAPTTGKPVALKPKNTKTPEATVEIKGKSKGSDQVVPDYKNAAKKPK